MNFDNFIIFDTEYTSWEGSQERNWSLDYEHKEIICISALKVNNTNNKLTIIDKFNYYVKPLINPILSDYIINLTGITQDLIDKEGYHFVDVLEKFYIFCEDFNIYSYGDDYAELSINMKLNNISIDSKYYTWKSKFYNIRPFFENYNINTSNYTSGSVYKSLKLNPIENVQIHNSLWDTYSIFITIEYILLHPINNKSDI